MVTGCSVGAEPVGEVRPGDALEERIGRSTFGVGWRAYHAVLKHLVAVKAPTDRAPLREAKPWPAHVHN